MIWYGNAHLTFMVSVIVTACNQFHILAPNPSDPKLNLVKQVLEEQHKIMSRLLKKYWLELGNTIPGLEAMQYAIFDTFLKCQTKCNRGEILNTF